MKKPDLPMYLIFAEASVNIRKQSGNLTGKEPGEDEEISDRVDKKI